MQQRCGADSVREVRPVPVSGVRLGVGLARRQDESMREFKELQEIGTPTPFAHQKAFVILNVPQSTLRGRTLV